MKRTLPRFLLGCLLLAACSKSGTFDDRSTENTSSTARVRDEGVPVLEPEPAPIPVDTLELDSLRHDGTN